MKVIISGKTGYLGTLISNELQKNNHEIIGLNRKDLYGSIEKLGDKIAGADVIINLAGAPILQRWTKKNKKIIYDSRVNTTQNVVIAINTLSRKQQPKKFISASAIGIYKAGFSHDETSTNFDDGFIGCIVKNWEKPLQDLPENIQQNIFRIGLVLGKNAKIIRSLLFPFKIGLGATIGTGEQAFPFIHEKDVVRAFAWAVENLNNNGTYNLTAPENIDNKIFTTELANKLHRPAFLSIPNIFFKLILGKASVLLTKSPEVSSNKIIKDGFNFDYPSLDSAFDEILG